MRVGILLLRGREKAGEIEMKMVLGEKENFLENIYLVEGDDFF
jgi:hypothetical protein